ncbi:unnamed protein product [Adineta steineri]|uniref:Condensation domain-containing protein n=1 Tax=Adineta steineri TaxID=433720 RepID=A0A814SYH7_9BILA|nr:unnamed protein product [Adineta steineri]CAF0847385.1 unnamed protein product [Adineta steineri]CAF1153535.1 unnamed protein product [Adineta steineri]
MDELLEAILTEWQSHFNIENGPLFGAGYLYGFAEGKARIWDCPRAYGAHINVLLLTAVGYALKQITETRMNYVTLEGHGREDIDGGNVDISRTVGWFTTMYPVLLEIDDDLVSSIGNVKVHLMEVPNKGIGYGPIIGYKNQELPRVSFNYLGQFEAVPSIKASRSNNTRRWYLTEGVVGVGMKDDQVEKTDDGDMVAVNGFCMQGRIRFDITSRLNSEKTSNFINEFKSKLEDIVRECFTVKPLIQIDYSNDFESPFVLLNADSDNTLFILPPGDGGAESYFNNIIPHLSAYKLIIFNNYYYNLKEKNMEKATKVDNDASLQGQSELFKYYTNIPFNGLDTLVNPKYIRLIEMPDQTHHSWMLNQEQVTKICHYLASVLK